jgi:hypothetical protein
MDFYKCYRAYVRGKVESFHSVAHAAPEAERQASAARARRYFQLALQYAVAGSQPMVLVVAGRIASGKSTLARALSAELGWDAYSSDRLRKTLARFPLHERGSPSARRRLYSAAMTAKTYDSLLTAAEGRVKQGHCVVLDATFGSRAHRLLLARRFMKRGIAWRFLEVRASNPTVKQRLRQREARADEVSDARLEDFPSLTRHYEPPVEVPKDRLVKVKTSTPQKQTVVEALTALACAQARSYDHPAD